VIAVEPCKEQLFAVLMFVGLLVKVFVITLLVSLLLDPWYESEHIL